MTTSKFPIWPIVLFLLIFPWFLRRRPRVTRSIVIKVGPADVFSMINQLPQWSRWTVWGRTREMAVTYLGPEAGVGATQRWQMKEREGIMSITRSVPDSLVQYDLRLGRGTHQLVGRIKIDRLADELSRITWTCVWDARQNPYARYLDLAMRWWMGRDFSSSLSNLQELLEKKGRAAPTPV